MATTVQSPWEPTQNHLLGSLTADDRAELLRDAQAVQLGQQQVLLLQNEPVRHAYFPLAGLFTLLRVMRSGRAAGTAVVGLEGAIGASAVLADKLSAVEAVCHVPGPALRVPADCVRRNVADRPTVREALLAHIAALLEQTQRNAGCNRLHGVESRLARWLLTAQDRLGAESLPLTQEVMSTLLGVRRASASKAAEALQTRNAIQYRRGHVMILDARLLESVACECYAALRSDNDPQLG